MDEFTRTGDQLADGDVFKLAGRWVTVAGTPWVPEIGGSPMPSAREVPTGPDPDGYGPPTVLVFVSETYQLAGAPGTAITVPTYPSRGSSVPVTTFVTFTKREYGGWIVRLASNGRPLGWLTPDHRDDDILRPNGCWSARVDAQAFRGAGPDDTGHCMDEVPGYLYNEVRTGGSGSAAIATGCASRVDAAAELLSWLHRKTAPALGYGRHWDVRAYDDPVCPGTDQRWDTTADGTPCCGTCGLDFRALYTKRPYTRRGRVYGKVNFHLASQAARTTR